MSSAVSFWILLLAVLLAAAQWPNFSLAAPAILSSERQTESFKVKVKCNLDVAACLRGKKRCCNQLQTVDADCFCSIAKKVAVAVNVDVGVEVLKSVCPGLVDVHLRVKCPGHN